jgi:DNA-directed RNA polymerase II subunit RPB1
MSYKSEEKTISNIEKVIGVQFGIMGPEEIRNRSVVKIVTQETYNGNEPVIGGLFDPRMGVLDHGKICPTDGLNNKRCPGYFGHIEMARPVFHIHFLSTTIKILKCVCYRCSNLLVDKNSDLVRNLLEKKGKHRWAEIYSLSQKIKKCGQETENGCGAVQPDKITKDGVAKLYAEWKNLEGVQEGANKQHFPAEKVLKIFRRITDEDCEILGFSRLWGRPDWMICQVLPVPPPAVRPSVRQDNNQRMEDDLTHKLVDIIKTNKTLQQKIDSNSNPQIIDEWTTVLQYHIATFVDNEIPGVAPAAQRSGRPLKSIRQRLKTKEGRVRGNLMGKRVDFSARSVITPDPNIEIDELGVPKKIAMNLTVSETVTKYNIYILYKYIRNGPDIYPGAKTLKQGNRTLHLGYIVRDDLELNVGDVVNRHLVDGDYVLFNRQPSLHKMSMMGHRVRVMECSTFRLNVSVTSPYNADFDGDEMNMHVPQSLESMTELKFLAAVPLQIISPRSNKPVIGIVQDTLLGVNRLSKEKQITLQQLMNLMMWNNKYDGDLPEPRKITNKGKNIEYWTGNQILSLVLPEVNVHMGNKSYDDEKEDTHSDNFVKIVNGEIKQGLLDKDIFSKCSRGLVHMIFNDFGHIESKNFLDNVNNLVTNYLLLSGFSVGISDLIAREEIKEKVNSAIQEQKGKVKEVIKHVHLNIFENLTGKSNRDEFEVRVNNILRQATKIGGNIGLTSLSEENRMTNMVKAGSKGSDINIAQMITCLGQQSIDGKRVPYGFTDRTLPHFYKYDDGPEARGFVENSFMDGLTPQEFFFHAMGGREGLIDTAVKTSETGYIQRKLVKAMEDLRINYDSTVRNANDCIVQFIYGEDGMDSTKIESQMYDYCNEYNKFIEKNYFDKTEIWSNFMLDDTITEMTSNVNWKSKLEDYFELLSSDRMYYISFMNDYQPNNAIYYPVHIDRIINYSLSLFRISESSKSDLNPIHVINEIEKLTTDLIITDINKGNKLFKILLRKKLNPVKLIKRYRINKNTFDYIITNIRMRFYESLVHPGEMVGAIAAQSIGEPATQMTLNTFHFAGVQEKSNVTRGVPRLKELLHISKNPKNPSLTIPLKKEYCYSKEKSKEILTNIELTSLNDITSNTKIYYDPTDFETNIEEDKEFLKIYQIFNEIDPVCHNIESPSNWLLRLEFDRMKMMDKNISMDDIHYCLNTVYEHDISCIFSDDNFSKLICRIRINQELNTEEDQTDDIMILKTLESKILDKIVLRGIEKIKNVTMRQINSKNILEDNDLVNKPEWVLDTDGVNLLEVINNEFVNYQYVISSDIHETYRVLGVEAARQTLFNELNDVIDAAASYVNYRHLALLVDTMTSKGGLMSIDRHGINRGDIGPLAKCSFEETTDQLLKAAIFGEYDKLSGVSANIMMGQVPPCGTGSSKILFDEVMFSNLIQDMEHSDEEEESDIDSEFDLENDDQDYCHTEKFKFKYNIDNIEGEKQGDNIPKTKFIIVD